MKKKIERRQKVDAEAMNGARRKKEKKGKRKKEKKKEKGPSA